MKDHNIVMFFYRQCHDLLIFLNNKIATILVLGDIEQISTYGFVLGISKPQFVSFLQLVTFHNVI